MERKEAERKGLAIVSKPKQSGAAVTDHDSKKENTVVPQYDFNLADLSVYLRWLLIHNKNDQDISMFLNRVQVSL
jgi:hypothetical protein